MVIVENKHFFHVLVKLLFQGYLYICIYRELDTLSSYYLLTTFMIVTSYYSTYHQFCSPQW